jgi:adenylate cyclase
MADVFVSYARSDKPLVAPLVAAIEGRGWSVWWDPAIALGQEFDDQIAAELGKARAVVVLWTPTSVASRWVRGEAREAADRGILVPARLDSAKLPFDVRAIHTIDLDGWGGDPASRPFQELLRALEARSVRPRRAPPLPGARPWKHPRDSRSACCPSPT